MRKFPKLLAVVLAIAIVICPAMCLTSMAEDPANDYSVAYSSEDGAVTVNVSAENGFVVALLRLDVVGFIVDEDNITVDADAFGLGDPGTVVANPDFDESAGVLSLLIASNDATNIDLIASATVTIPVEKSAGEGEDYGITLTTIQAADQGTIDESTGTPTAPEALLAFPYVSNAEDGAIDPAAAGEKVVAVAPCQHNNTTPVHQDATCTEDGYDDIICNDCGETVSHEVLTAGHDLTGELEHDDDNHWYTCNNCEAHINEAPHEFDDETDAICDICGYEREIAPAHVCSAVTYVDNGDGTHDGICDCVAATVVVDDEPHVFDQNEGTECICGAKKAPAVCQHENATFVVTKYPTKDAEGSKTYTCPDCTESWNEAIPAITNSNSAITVTYSGGLKATPYMTFAFDKSKISASFNECTDIRLAVSRKNNGGSYNFGDYDIDIVDYTNTTSKIYYYYYNVELYSLTVPIKAVLYYTDPDGNFCRSDEFTTTFNETLKGLYTKASNAKLKTTIVDIVKAGSAVQSFVTDGKPNCDYAKLLMLPDDAALGVWSSTELADATADLGSLRSYAKDGSANGITLGKSAGVNSNGYLAFSVKGIAAADRNDYAMELVYDNAITKETTTKVRSLGVAGDDVTLTSSTVWVYIRDLPMVSTNAQVSVKVYRVAEPGVTLATYDYSFEDYISDNLENSNQKLVDALVALGKVGKSFRANNSIPD